MGEILLPNLRQLSLMNKGKLNRRDVIKVYALATGALAAVPFLPKFLKFGEEPQKSPTITNTNGEEPLVILVQGDELRGYRGLEEYTVKDGYLASRLFSSFQQSTE